MLTMVMLNNGQLDACKRGIRWWSTLNKQVFKIVGGPGTGKTTLVFALIQYLGLELDEVLFCTYVGKAALALILNNVNAKTIHSTIFKFESETIDIGSKRIRRTRMVRRDRLPRKIKLIVVDEAGMVNEQMENDLRSFGTPIIALGDQDQLPPVFGKSRMIENPDVILTEIMRQKAGDPIIHLADLARRGKDIELGQYGKRCFVVDTDILEHNWIFNKFNMVICGKNKTRDELNERIRYDIKGYNSPFPKIGDKIVCRKNNWNESIGDVPLINGLFGKVLNVYKNTFNGRTVEIDFQPDCVEDDYFENILLDYEYLKKTHEERAMTNKMSAANIFEYGYASTCHLAQGSQAPAVMILEEMIGSFDLHRRWLYTGITRAEQTLMIVKRKPKKKFYFGY